MHLHKVQFSCFKLAVVAVTLIGKVCNIIISSSWRFHYPIDYLLGLFPASLRRQVAGDTGDVFAGKQPRHGEILTDVLKRAGQSL